MKERYFAQEESIAQAVGTDPKKVMEIVAQRYIGENPRTAYALRAFSTEAFRWLEDGELIVDLGTHYPQATLGEMSYAAARLNMEADAQLKFCVQCFGPTRLYVNGEMVFHSSNLDDINPNRKESFMVNLKKGWNDFIIRCIKTNSGFGCLFSFDGARWWTRNFQEPFLERKGRMSFAYSGLFKQSDFLKPEFTLDQAEADSGLTWYPTMTQEENIWSEIFGKRPGLCAYARTGVELWKAGTVVIRGGAKAWVDRQEVDLSAPVALTLGYHDILLQAVCTEDGNWPEKVEVLDAQGENLPLVLVPEVHGTNRKIMVAGPFDGKKTPSVEDLMQVCRLYETVDGTDYWHLGRNVMVRPSFEQPLFGRWNYPVGVTMYGLQNAGRCLGRKDITEYARSHIMQCVDFADYSVWDMEKYGFASVNVQLAALHMLDDCGSFGLAMLDSTLEGGSEKIDKVAHRIANYIETKQERTPEGAFRRNLIGTLNENTMWVDDLYMGTPFLARYASMYGDENCMEDAARQFGFFMNYLYMPEKKLLSHIYSFGQETKTGVAWGRGNGWAMFSCSEVLSKLPKDHPRYQEVLEEFLTLSEGYLARQGENGLWHQVLDEPDSYEESSCTSMFIYAFCKGIENGWYQDKAEEYKSAALKGWKGLCDAAIDKKGNVYGVCRGSEYSYLKEYYMYELLPILNDTHGIGIVLLAAQAIGRLE